MLSSSNLYLRSEDDPAYWEFLKSVTAEEKLDRDLTIAVGNERGPIALPRREFKHYDNIQNVYRVAFRDLIHIWAEYKPKIAKQFLLENREVEKGFFLEKSISDGFQSVFDSMLGEFSETANGAFDSGVRAGNDYFEDMFKIKGLEDEQVFSIRDGYLETFQDRTQDLFQDKVIDKLGRNGVIGGLSGLARVLSTFDHLLRGFANAAAGVAYEVFSNAVMALNASLFSPGKLGEVPQGRYVVQWVLGEVKSRHSVDCIIMARGKSKLDGGIGVWDPQELSDTGLTPKSSRLDCGGNCKCHLRPIPLSDLALKDNPFLEGFTKRLKGNDVFEIEPNMSRGQLDELFTGKFWDIPPAARELILQNKFMRRVEFWENIPARGVVDGTDVGFKVVFVRSVSGNWDVTGLTRIVGQGKNAAPGSVTVTVHVPHRFGGGLSDLDPDNLKLIDIPNIFQQKIKEITAHELAHSMSFSVDDIFQQIYANKKTFSNIFSEETSLRVRDIMFREYNLAVAKVSQELDDVIKKAQSALKDRPSDFFLKENLDLIHEALGRKGGSNIVKVYQEILNSILQGKKIVRRKLLIFPQVYDPAVYMQEFTEALRKLGVGKDLVSYYQLYNPNEYFAEFMSILLTNPARARILNNRMMKDLAEEFKEFGTGTLTKTGPLAIPEQISLHERFDVPIISELSVLPPNATFKEIFPGSKITVKTKRVSKEAIRRQIREVFKVFPNLQRKELFEGLDFEFLSRQQMRNKFPKGSSMVAQIENGKLTINHDFWRNLSRKKKAEVISSALANNAFETSSRVRTQVRQTFTNYIQKTLTAVRAKAERQGIAGRDIDDFMDVILGSSASGDTPARPRNLRLWTRIFNSEIYPVLKNIPDLPIMSIESLANPRIFFQEWLKMYMTNPQMAFNYSPETMDIFRTLF